MKNSEILHVLNKYGHDIEIMSHGKADFHIKDELIQKKIEIESDILKLSRGFSKSNLIFDLVKRLKEIESELLKIKTKE